MVRLDRFEDVEGLVLAVVGRLAAEDGDLVVVEVGGGVVGARLRDDPLDRRVDPG